MSKIMVAFDYGQLEARLIGMASEDPYFEKMILTGWDIHNYWAIRFLKKYPKLKNGVYQKGTEADIKKFRGDVKNDVSFPWIYDASYKLTAALLSMPENLVKDLYDEFWEMLKVVKEWKKETHREYETNGYVETLYGSRRHAPLNYTMIVNTKIQGTGGYVNLAAMNRLARLSYFLGKEQYQARINVHDDLTFCLEEASIREDILFIAKEMCRKTHKWMGKIPLQVEVKVGHNWGELEEVIKLDTRDFHYSEKIEDEYCIINF